jgi:hypothetical protein
MKETTSILFALAISLATSSCMMFNGSTDVSEEIVEKQFPGNEFTSISASSEVVVIVSTVDHEQTITVSGPQNVVEDLELKYDDNRLSVHIRRGERFKYRSDNEKAHVYVSSNDISHLTSTSGATIEVLDTLKNTASLNVVATAGGAVTFECVECPAIGIKSLTGGQVSFKDVISERITAYSYTGGTLNISGETNTITIKGDKNLVNTKKLALKN